MEQYVRDIRVATIFEGTTGIQAIDLLTRKLVDANGERWHAFVETLRRDVLGFGGRVRPKDAEMFTEALASLEHAASEMRKSPHSRSGARAGGATPFLQMVAIVALGWTWLRLAAAGYDEANSDAKLGNVSHFFFRKCLSFLLVLSSAGACGRVKPDAIRVLNGRHGRARKARAIGCDAMSANAP